MKQWADGLGFIIVARTFILTIWMEVVNVEWSQLTSSTYFHGKQDTRDAN
jgi:hypothetical protein